MHFQRLRITRKKMSLKAREQSEAKIAQFIHATQGIVSDRLFFLDETSTDKRTYTRPYGRSRIGRRAQGFRVFVRGQRYSSCGTYCFVFAYQKAYLSRFYFLISMTFLSALPFSLVSMPLCQFASQPLCRPSVFVISRPCHIFSVMYTNTYMYSHHTQQRHRFVSHNSRFVQHGLVPAVLRASFGTLILL